MKARLDNLESAFAQNIAGVHKLIHFDREVLGFAVAGIRDLSERLKQHHKLGNPYLTAENTLKSIENIRDNDSLRPRYKVIFNQAVVLLVSYFGSAVEDIFKAGVDALLDSGEDSDLLREDIKLSFREMQEASWHFRGVAADLLVQKKDLSFQDMQAISRTFKTYLGITIEKDNHVNNIILAQACRHVIVHAGGAVNDRLIRQVANATPREIKPAISRGEHIEFQPEEVELISRSMEAYVKGLVIKVKGMPWQH
ncbi:MAG: hypothetical protein HY799_11945 [Nitrosomonadales bacterium]|nr:hypothetical protein [Nitrosomonadales bacterium]